MGHETKTAVNVHTTQDSENPHHHMTARRNWHKSAKAMEGDIAVQMHQEAAQTGLRYSNVIGDEDASYIKQIREKCDATVNKFSDIGHVKRTLNGKLEKLQKQHKSLTLIVRRDFVKIFTYAVHFDETWYE